MPVLSASQVSTFGTVKAGGNNVGCERKWGLKYLAELPDPSGPSAESGKQVHGKLEAWLKQGIMPKGTALEDKIARAMLKHLPAPPQAHVEEPFTMEVDGVKWRGFKDLVYYDGTTCVVHDHKTTSGLQWAKDADTLRHDTQCVLYARHAFQDNDVVDMSWLYGTRERSPQIKSVRFNITWDDVSAAMPPLTATGKRILELYTEKPDPNTLEANLDMCEAYGGCPYKSNGCSITALDRVRAKQRQHNIKEQKTMGFRDRLQKKEVIETTGTVVPDAPAAPAKPSMRERLVGVGAAIAPPPFVKFVAAVAADGAAKAQEEIAAPPDGIEAEQVGAALKRKGRKPGSKNKPKEDTSLSAEPLTPLVPHVEAPPASSSGDFILLVNAFADVGPVQLFSEIAGPVFAAVAEREGVADYRLVEYGKGPGMVAAALYTFLQEHPLSGHVLLDARTDEGRVCLPTLERFAKAVYRGY